MSTDNQPRRTPVEMGPQGIVPEDAPGDPAPVELPPCPHVKHQLDTPASWLPTRGHAILTQLLMPLAVGFGHPVAALGLAEDGGPLLCCCASLDVAQALTDGAIVAVPSTTYDREQAAALTGAPAGSPVDVFGLNEPGQPTVWIFGISDGLRDGLILGAEIARVTEEVARDGDAN
ncbi:hypothetical protein KBX71_07730 [Micromonospora sp. D93]|uniref:hypothetical protein n=1 Tax=Micromonospora sp. D93 TaxID=2824886 RepID=UPI001B3917BD|nr:hypothetical protein [Micromonospora sp. D93]MBQ1017759.1 hypothetical protein [Micromonospora sp. D93]